MSDLGRMTKRLVQQEDGAASIEYALLLVFIALVVIAGAFAIGQAVNDLYSDAQEKVETTGSHTTSQQEPP